jgi:hypothetical protein
MQEIALFLAALSAGFAFALKWYALWKESMVDDVLY